MGLLIGVDVGTTNIKALLYDPERGMAVATASRPTIAHHPRPGWSEFDPLEVWASVAETIREVAYGAEGGAVTAVGVASMGEAGLPLDARGRYLYPIIAWHDPRTETIAKEWSNAVDEQRIYNITGLSARPIYGLFKLLWLKAHEPAVYAAMRYWLSVEDFILWKLTGERVTDYTMASRTMAFDQGRLAWSEEVLNAAGVSGRILPKALPSGSAVGRLTRDAAAETGLATSTIAATGGHDHLCGAFAAGLIDGATVLDSTGTAQAVLALTNDFRPSARLRKAGLSYYGYVTRNRYTIQAGLSAAGGALAWLVALVGSDLGDGAHDVLLAEAEEVAVGSRGLLWLPHLLGSVSPENDPDSRGAVLGLTTAHGRAELVRALLEALGYSLRQNVELLEGVVRQAVGEIIAIGGATRSELWVRLKAEVTGRPVGVPDIGEATAVGAGLLAGVAAGVFADEAAALASLRSTVRRVLPDDARAREYDRLYRECYKPLYRTVRALSHKLARETGSSL